jgi:pimeloyl-ACP methyl ester carboxylesterase
MDLRVLQGGRGGPLLLLLHGLGATADVWDRWPPLLGDAWPGRWVSPDLPGHGGSPPLPAYSFEALARAVAPLVDPDGHTVVFGHSLGGVIGLLLQPVRAVIGLGIKVEWSADDLQRAGAMAERAPVWYATREEAANRYLRVAGLAGLIATDDPAVDAGLRERDGQWGLALDLAAFAVGAPDMPELVAGTTAAVVLARGAEDPMNTDAQLARLGAETVTLPGLGHNAHVENPAACVELLRRFG